MTTESLASGIDNNVSNQHIDQETQLENILMNELTKSQMRVYEVLKDKDMGITPKDLLEEVNFAPRTVRYALRKLLKKKIVRRVPNLRDTRQWIYAVRPVEQILEQYNT
jgi:DNA-binding MarR family transcriptional regulator